MVCVFTNCFLRAEKLSEIGKDIYYDLLSRWKIFQLKPYMHWKTKIEKESSSSSFYLLSIRSPWFVKKALWKSNQSSANLFKLWQHLEKCIKFKICNSRMKKTKVASYVISLLFLFFGGGGRKNREDLTLFPWIIYYF